MTTINNTMKIFYGSVFMEQKKLQEVGIEHPIKLEYYKIINEDEIVKQKKAKFGIHVIKTEYRKNEIKIEDKKVKHISSDENKIEEILNILKENEVTPVILEDILSDYSKQTILI